MKSEIKIFIADDHPIFRDGLKSLIEKDARLKVVGEAGDGSEAFEKLSQMAADIAILDIDMPGNDGFEVAQKMRENNLPTEIIFLTMHNRANIPRKLDLKGSHALIKYAVENKSLLD